MTKYALIINGDTNNQLTYKRHIGNVEHSLANVFEAEGFETFVISPERPATPCDHYLEPTKNNVKALINEISSKIGPDDELVVYTTGHGEAKSGKGELCIGSECDSDIYAPLIDKLSYGRRTVIMDQCFSGNWNRIFIDDPNTLFISAGSREEATCCVEMAEKLWAPAKDVPDLNGDGTASWRERYGYAAKDVKRSEPQFIPTPGYVMDGSPEFTGEVIDVESEDEFDSRLKGLQPGQYAFIMYSSTGCHVCRKYDQTFERAADDSGGQHLFIRTQSDELAKKAGITTVPTVVITSAGGIKKVAEDREHLMEELARFEVPIEEGIRKKLDELAAGQPVLDDILTKFSSARLNKDTIAPLLERFLAIIEQGTDKSYHFYPKVRIAMLMANAGMGQRADEIYDELLAKIESGEEPGRRADRLINVAWSMSLTKGHKKLAKVYDMAFAATAKDIQNVGPGTSCMRYMGIAYSLALSKDTARAAKTFEMSVRLANKTAGYSRIRYLNKIAATMAEVGMRERAGQVYQMTASIAEEFETPEEYAERVLSVIQKINDTKLGKKAAAEVHDRLMSYIEGIKDLGTLSMLYSMVARSYFYNNDDLVRKKAVSMFEKAISAANDIRGIEERTKARGGIVWALNRVHLNEKAEGLAGAMVADVIQNTGMKERAGLFLIMAENVVSKDSSQGMVDLFYLEAVAAIDATDDAKERLRSYTVLAGVFIDAGRKKEADELLDRAVASAAQIVGLVERAKQSLILTNYLELYGRDTLKDKVMKMVLVMSERAMHPAVRAKINMELARHLYHRQEDDCAVYYARAEKAVAAIGDRIARIDATAGLAASFASTNHSDRSHETFEKAVSLAMSIEAPDTRVFVLSRLAGKLVRVGANRAVDVYKDAIAATGEVEDYEEQSVLLRLIMISVIESIKDPRYFSQLCDAMTETARKIRDAAYRYRTLEYIKSYSKYR